MDFHHLTRRRGCESNTLKTEMQSEKKNKLFLSYRLNLLITLHIALNSLRFRAFCVSFLVHFGA